MSNSNRGWPPLPTHLLQDAEHHGDLLRVEEPLRHQGQAGLGVPLQLVVAVVVLHGGDLQRRQGARSAGTAEPRGLSAQGCKERGKLAADEENE